MEELFETFQDEMGFSHMEDEGPEEEDSVPEPRPNFNTPQALRFEEPLANLLNEQHRTVKELLEQLRIKKSSTKQQPEAERPKPQSDKVQQTLILDAAQRKRLQQQMQQHVQLLTQIHLLSSANPGLTSEANTTKMFLRELGTFAQSSVVLHHQFNPKFQTMFQPCNLKGAMQLIEDFHSHIHIDWSPRKNVKKSASEFPCLPKQVAWILATSKVFMYPELLPICSLKAKNPRDKIFFTKAEDNLLALGLKHFEGTEFPKPLISKYLLTAKSAHQLTVRIKNLNINRAPDNIIKYYKKTKQLPILFKCCEELQPDQWKPPVEREERHLPFWLKASLPSIQEELQHLANDVGESGNLSEVAEPSSEPGLDKDSMESRNENRYPLLLPKGVVLTLKPLAKRFSRKAWRQRRSSVLKPLLIRPSPALQPGSTTGRTPTRLSQSEAPPSKVVVRIPSLIQPATVLQSVPGGPPLGVTGGDGFELPMALPSVAPENGTCLPQTVSQTLLSPAPAGFQPKVMLPALVTSKPRKPGTKRGLPKRERTKPSPLLKATPILRPAPVILTVPATTVKVVSLSNGCNMIQPLGAAVAQSPQTIPITTLLVSPTSFPCPLNQPLVASSIPPLIVSSNPVNLPVPPTPEDNTQVKSDIPCPPTEGKSTFPTMEPKLEPQELSALSSTLSPKEEHSPVPPPPGKATSQGDPFEGNAHSWTVVKTTEGREVLEPLSQTSWETLTFLPGDLVEIVKVEPEDPGEEVKLPRNKSPEQNIWGEIKEEVSVELDTGPAGEGAKSTQEVKKEAVLQEEERGERTERSSVPHETQGEGNTRGEVSKGSPKNISSPTNLTALSSPLGKPEDSSSVDGQLVGTPAGRETGGEKDGPEEEEEEDFDDLTQDEEDEEMSSASEESVLSVPELQASLPSIQEGLHHLANDVGESENLSDVAEPSSEPGLDKGSLKSKNENRYPLQLPKGVVLSLKPLAKGFSRKAWCQRRSSVLKPLLIRPSPALQPVSSTGRTPTRLSQSEEPPSKVVAQIPSLIQPTTALQSVPGGPPTGGDSFELPMALPSVAPENGTCLPQTVSQTLLSPGPEGFQPKVMVPAHVTSKPRKRGRKRGLPKTKRERLLRPAPVILTVPATTIKVVSLGNGCNVIQPLGAAVAQSPQTIPITTLLVSPTSFPCPLNQPLVASSIPPLIVSSNPVNLPVPPTPEDNTQVKSDIPCPPTEGKSIFPTMEPKLEPQELSALSSTLSPKEEHSPVPPPPGKATSQGDPFMGNVHSWTVVRTVEGKEVLEPLTQVSWETLTFLPGNLVEIVKVEPEDPGEEVKLPRNKSPEQNIWGEIKEEVSVELDTGPAGEGAKSTQEVKKEAVLQEEERGERTEMSSFLHETQGEGNTRGEVSKGSPKNISSPTIPAALSSPLGKPEDSSSVDGQLVGTPAGRETGGEKDGPEEEEEEDFDDLTQDEEDEEMSSASEESVLSVPELQASLPSIQEGLHHLANDVGESENLSDVAEPSSEPGLDKGSLKSKNENRYPLQLPKGVVLSLKPLAKGFSRKAWCQRRSSVLKPLLIRPSPALQPVSSTGRTPTRLSQSEEPPSKVVAQIPSLIQPTTALQSVPGGPPTGGDSFELPMALPSVAPENGTCLPQTVSQTLLSPGPEGFQPKVMVPAHVTSKPRKRGRKRGLPKTKRERLLRPAPVILTVPATTIKVVSLGNGCNVIQPLGAAVAQSPQTIPIMTLLVSPTSFPCPLNQPLVASSIPPLIVSSNPVNLPVPPTPEDNTQVKSDIPCPPTEGKSIFPTMEPKLEPQELSALSSTLSPKEEHSPVPPPPGKATSQGDPFMGNVHSWTVVRTVEGKEVLEPLTQVSWETLTFLPGNLVEIVKVEPEDPGEEVKLPRNKSPEQNIWGEIKEEVSVELDTGPAGEGAKSTQEVKKEAVLQEEERGERTEMSSFLHETQGEGNTRGEVSKGSPKNISSPTIPAALSSPLGKPEDSSSVDGQLVGTPAGRETGGEKDGPEEEEEEDFDDLTQDEEDEEMSSASEESVLSVPELQETMEKLTWLASERRMSQEGDSEEENSQEENSEPEEEEEEEVSEGMENLQKEDEMMDEATEGPAQNPPSTFASPKVTPEVEPSRTPSGESTKAVGKARGSHRTRSKRGRTRASKDTSKLLLLYDEDILERDPLREQKDLAFAQAYLTRVCEALHHVPSKYEDFLRVIYEFESNTQRQTAVDLYNSLQTLFHDWPQLLKNFAAFLLPEQALACGLFEEQQVFEKSRNFLQQLEICFAENPSHLQKNIKLLQGCAYCLPQEIGEVCKSKAYKNKEPHEQLGASPPPKLLGTSPTPDAKEVGRGMERSEEEVLDERASRTPRAARKGEMSAPGSEMRGTLLPPEEGNSTDRVPLDVPAPCSPESPQSSPKAGLVPNSIRSQAGAEGIHSPSPKLQTLSEVQQAGALSGSGKPLAVAGCPASTLSPLPSNSTDGWDSGQGKADTPNSRLRPGRKFDMKTTSRIPTILESPSPVSTTSGAVHGLPVGGSPKGDSGPHIRGPDGEQQLKASEATVCANNSKVSSTGEKVVLWTREADRVILTMCQERGAQPQTFSTISQQLGNKTPGEVSHRFKELMQLFHTACEASSEDEDDATSTSNTDQLSDRGDLLSEEEPDE
ncbi:GON-4-like protein isoform X2 [Dromiciops gliroides]|nr:GON-4-like protein isoform X2 [Dromiciops gliroides]